VGVLSIGGVVYLVVRWWIENDIRRDRSAEVALERLRAEYEWKTKVFKSAGKPRGKRRGKRP